MGLGPRFQAFSPSLWHSATVSWSTSRWRADGHATQNGGLPGHPTAVRDHVAGNSRPDGERESCEERQVERFTARLLAPLVDDGQPFDFDLPLQGDRLAAVEGLRHEGHEPAPSTLLISLTAHARPMARTVHNAAATSGASGTAWQGPYRIGEPPSGWARARLRRDDRRVDRRLSLHSTHIRKLTISARFEHMRCLPASLECAFVDLPWGRPGIASARSDVMTWYRGCFG